MCLGIVGKVIEIDENSIAKIDVNGALIEADASFTPVKPGDYVVVHAGMIISKKRDEEALLQMDIRRKLLDYIDEELD